MYVLIGLAVVAISIVVGFMMEKGNPAVFFQPAELFIIAGSALGAFLIANPPKVIASVLKALPTLIKGRNYSKKDFLKLLSLVYHIFTKMKREGQLSIETDIEKPKASDLFKGHSAILQNEAAISFLCDNLKVIVSRNISAYELEGLLDIEIETYEEEELIPSNSIAMIADAMPGLGLVAAVLGVVLTMGKIDQAPEVVGHSVAVALLGTFFGIMLCYAIISPLAQNLKHAVNDDVAYLQVIKICLISYVKGVDPVMSVEFGRRAIPGKARPTFTELEKSLRH